MVWHLPLFNTHYLRNYPAFFFLCSASHIANLRQGAANEAADAHPDAHSPRPKVYPAKTNGRSDCCHTNRRIEWAVSCQEGHAHCNVNHGARRYCTGWVGKWRRLTTCGLLFGGNGRPSRQTLSAAKTGFCIVRNCSTNALVTGRAPMQGYPSFS